MLPTWVGSGVVMGSLPVVVLVGGAVVVVVVATGGPSVDTQT